MTLQWPCLCNFRVQKKFSLHIPCGNSVGKMSYGPQVATCDNETSNDAPLSCKWADLGPGFLSLIVYSWESHWSQGDVSCAPMVQLTPGRGHGNQPGCGAIKSKLEVSSLLFHGWTCSKCWDKCTLVTAESKGDNAGAEAEWHFVTQAVLEATEWQERRELRISPQESSQSYLA